ncbi:tyrosine-type recombinase/integrase [Paraburkholderia sp. LEh10]|uniref:site-specific integrase n=1 Tax=Paraburkholderia sp. LEh10 TaxID=2821353 RepID=UPI001AE23CDB|nr:site-specific integrase [Paraburkholderia sp. LEh10]MBP0591941.1 tyrosine-type recombinase/integrase [Paraburkholderia sp. LEh10]
MIRELLPTAYARHLSLPLLGPILDDFDDWLVLQGYRFNSRQCYLLRCTAIDAYFRKRHRTTLASLTPEGLRKCSQYFRRRPGGISNTVGCLQRFFQDQKIVAAQIPRADTPFEAPVAAYLRYLSEVRGLSRSTIEQHEHTVWQLLRYQLASDITFRLADFTQAHIERFIVYAGSRYGRSTLQHVVSDVRGFLRFLALRSEVPPGLDQQIDTPRAYRLEHLPRALSWDTVTALLESIDRKCASGVRDYAIFLLIGTYGLRGCDIASLRLDDIDWHAGEIHINQSKTRHPLTLPLTDPVATALIAYLQEARPRASYREIFLTAIAPTRPITRQAPGYAYRFRVRQSGLVIPYQGVHCLRHSYAAHLLHEGVPLKTIGDLLGHRSTESTCVYLRLDHEELREVALPLPAIGEEVIS